MLYLWQSLKDWKTYAFALVYTGADASLSIRHGRWLNVESSTTTFIFQWSSTDETLSLVPRNDHKNGQTPTTLGALRAKGMITYAALEAATSNIQQSTATHDESSTTLTTTTLPTTLTPDPPASAWRRCIFRKIRRAFDTRCSTLPRRPEADQIAYPNAHKV